MQLGCNQGAKGCNPKSVQKHTKNGPSWASQYQHEVGRASTERRLGEPVSNLNGLGEPVSKRGWANQYLKTNPPGPVGRTIEKKSPKPLPGPLGRPLKNETPPDPLGEPVGRKRVQPKKACKKHTKYRPEAWAPEDTLPKQAKNNQKTSEKPTG